MFKTTRKPSDLTFKQKSILMIGIFLCMELGMMVSAEFAVALPQIIKDVGGAEFYSLVFAANLAMGVIVTPIVGKLSDIYGRRQLLIIGVLIVLISEAITPLLVSNIYHLMIFRAIQGLGGTATIVIGLIVISDLFDVENRAKFLGFYGSLNALTAIVAPTVGGLFVQYMSWHWVFYSIIPVGVIGLIIIFKLMPDIPRLGKAKIDFLGVGLLSVTILILVGITNVGGTYVPWSSLTMLGIVVAFFVAFALFVVSQKKSSSPILPLHLFKYKVFNICIFCCFACMFAATGIVYFSPLFFQNIHGFTPTDTGLFLTQRGLTSFIFAAVAGFLVAKLKDFRMVAIGTMLLFVGVIFSFTFFTSSGTFLIISIICLIWGLASGILTSIFHMGVQMNIPQKDLSVAMGVVHLSVSLGALLATAFFGLTLRLPNLVEGFNLLLYICLGVVAFALIIFFVGLQIRGIPKLEEVPTTVEEGV